MSGEQSSDLSGLTPPKGEQAHVWLCRVCDSIDRADTFLPLLSSIERDQAARFVSSQARNNFLVGRGVLRTLLGTYLSIPASQIAFEINPQGKPRIAAVKGNSPLAFNLAHTGDWVLVGITSAGEIGVDIERHRSVAHWQGIAERHYSGRELAALQAANGAEQLELFFRIWTRKEAVLKWHGTGLQAPLSSVEVPLNARCQAWVELPQLSERCWLQSIDAPAGHSAALATSQPCEVVRREFLKS